MREPDSPLWRLGAAAMALATAFAVVAACGSDADNSPAPPAAGSHSAHAGASAGPPQPLRAGERFLDLKMAEAYTPAPPDGAVDEYRCQVLDPGLTRTAFLTGTQVMPENVAIAHHGIVYAVPPGKDALVREQDAKTPGPGWQCSAGPAWTAPTWRATTRAPTRARRGWTRRDEAVRAGGRRNGGPSGGGVQPGRRAEAR